MPDNKSEISRTLDELSPKEWYGYATYNEKRSANKWGARPYKRHKTLGHAKNALKSSYGTEYVKNGKIFEWDLGHGRWVATYEVVDGNLCKIAVEL